MNRKAKLLVALALTATSLTASAEFYKVYVKRVDSNLYKTSEGVFIETRYCYHYSYGEEAILKYEPYSYDNKIIWDDDSTCDVKRVFK
jgi:hypothetical protein